MLIAKRAAATQALALSANQAEEVQALVVRDDGLMDSILKLSIYYPNPPVNPTSCQYLFVPTTPSSVLAPKVKMPDGSEPPPLVVTAQFWQAWQILLYICACNAAAGSWTISLPLSP